MALAGRLDLHVVEDNAHGLGGSYRGRPLGSFGRLAAHSFHETKNVQCGEGGALVANDPELVLPIEVGREKGTDRSSFFRGEVDKYTWRARGSSDLMPEITAALLVAQLEAFDDIQHIRRGVWTAYRDGLDDWARQNDVQFQAVPSDCVHPSHLFAMLLPTPEQRNDFIRHMSDEGVMAIFHYVPLHDSPAGRSLGRTSPLGCSTTTDVSDRLVRLPLHAHLSSDDVDRVVTAASAWKS
jgi:dTDP-4-amino-4,6-dideoxygalactose transaminase